MILFDIEPLQNEDYKNRGIGRYVRNLLAAAREAGRPFAVTYNADLPPPDVSRLEVPEKFIPASRANFRRQSFDWLVTTSPYEKSLGATQRLFKSCFPTAKVATIAYDVIPMVFEADYLSNSLERIRYNINSEAMLRSDVILTISDHTRHDILEYLKPRCDVFTIGTGVDRKFFDEDHSGTAHWAGIATKYSILENESYIFTVSGGHKSKNLHNLLKAYAECPLEFRIAHPLVVGGGFAAETRRHFMDEWERILKTRKAGYSDILILPVVSDDDVSQLYSRCHLFVYASIYEGYGLPLAEAIVRGAVCVSSSRSSLKEIMPLPEFQFNPYSTADIAQFLQSGCQDDQLRERFRQWAAEAKETFRWNSVGQKITEYLPAKVAHGSSVAPKYAVIGPLRPAVSGIASYDSELLPHMDEKFHWFCPSGFSPIAQKRRALPLSAYDESCNQFDDSIYVIGNSFHHLQALKRLHRRPGIVWLHDVRLSFIAWDFAHSLNPQDPISEINRLAATYSTHRRHISSFQDLDDSVFSFARPLLGKATGFIVHSHQARELLIEDLGGEGDAPPIVVIPHAIVPPATVEKKESWSGDRPLRVGTLGFLHPIRAPEKILAACGVVAAQGRRITFVILGQAPEDYVHDLRKIANPLNVEIETHGFLEDNDFKNAIGNLDVVVQIRKRTNGESSGTVSQAIAAGVPVITNIPSVHEFWGEYTIPTAPKPTAGELADLILRSQIDHLSLDMMNIRQEALESFSYPNVARMFSEAVSELYEQISPR